MGSYDTVSVGRMSALSGKDLRERWIANADRLDKRGHFGNYSSKQRDEVLRKGYLGRYPPDQAIKMARLQAEQGHGHRTPKFNDEMREHFSLVGAALGCEVFFKFQIVGTARKPQVLFWSCHPPLY